MMSSLSGCGTGHPSMHSSHSMCIGRPRRFAPAPARRVRLLAVIAIWRNLLSCNAQTKKENTLRIQCKSNPIRVNVIILNLNQRYINEFKKHFHKIPLISFPIKHDNLKPYQLSYYQESIRNGYLKTVSDINIIWFTGLVVKLVINILS